MNESQTTPAVAEKTAGPPLRGRALAIEFALLGLLALIWGSSYGMIKMAVATLAPLTVVLIRSAVAAAFLWMVVLWRGDAVPRSRRTWGHFFIQGLTASIIPFSLIAWGQQVVDSSLASVLNSTSPLFVFVFTALWTRHEATSGLRLFGIGLGLGGTTLIIGVDALQEVGRYVAGELAIMAAAVFYALSAVFSRHFRGIAPPVTSAATLSLSTLAILPFAFAFESPFSQTPAGASLVATVLLGLLSTAVAAMLYYRLINTLGSMSTSSVSYLRAGVSVLIGVLLLDEPFTWSLAIGLAAVVGGVAAINARPASGLTRS